MTRVAVSGAGGRMGRIVMEAVSGADDLELVSAFDPSHAGETIFGVVVASDPTVVGEADVVVEFTVPTVVMANLAAWRNLGVHAVVGTSGFDAGRLEALREQWGSGPPNCLVVPNFSIGAVLMMKFAETAAPHFAASEIIELHHDAKADAPSGTALTTAARITAGGGRQDRKAQSEELIPGSRGADAGPRIHSVRLPGLLAHQEVLFGSAGETLTIRHDTTDRVSFMPGVLLAIHAVASLEEPVTVGLEGLLGL
ncbi:MAG: 4-hydroxy-tetrahydrodipicolinate reductase [Actinomycetota bacterium]|jgi:4-hydroxy-tetrahydrodipicolinate reductase|nr:4-hydroxy-tetrahydrodipicolinate reductase [Actinomycetota bacterium]